MTIATLSTRPPARNLSRDGTSFEEPVAALRMFAAPASIASWWSVCGPIRSASASSSVATVRGLFDATVPLFAALTMSGQRVAGGTRTVASAIRPPMSPMSWKGSASETSATNRPRAAIA